MIRRPPRSTQGVSSAASDVYKRQLLNDKKHKSYLDVPSHQYIYNLGPSKVNFIINSKKGILNPLDSLYIKPNNKHLFYKKGKLLVLRLGGKISGDSLYQLSMISENNLKKTINDNRPWFNK